jgi:hypothetical protein
LAGKPNDSRERWTRNAAVSFIDDAAGSPGTSGAHPLPKTTVPPYILADPTEYAVATTKTATIAY